MNTFYRTCVIICLGLLVFTLWLNYVQSTNAFPISETSGQDIGDTGTALGETSSLENPNMNWLWASVVAGIALGIGSAAAARWIGANVNATVLGGVSFFGTVFWASFVKTHSILSIGSFIDPSVLTIFTIITMFVFIAAIIGMLTGSG
jgi:hypothetical protein